MVLRRLGEPVPVRPGPPGSAEATTLGGAPRGKAGDLPWSGEVDPALHVESRLLDLCLKQHPDGLFTLFNQHST